MRNKKVLSLFGFVLVIVIGIALILFFKKPLQEEVQDVILIQPSVPAIPRDFDWVAYVQNYEDLRREGIDTEEKAKRHWMDFGRNEGRDYHVIVTPGETPRTLAMSATVASVEVFAVSPVVPPRTIPRVSLDSPLYDPASFRERYNKILKRAGIDTKEEAIEFSLAFWEKRRKAYFS